MPRRILCLQPHAAQRADLPKLLGFLLKHSKELLIPLLQLAALRHLDQQVADGAPHVSDKPLILHGPKAAKGHHDDKGDEEA